MTLSCTRAPAAAWQSHRLLPLPHVMLHPPSPRPPQIKAIKEYMPVDCTTNPRRVPRLLCGVVLLPCG